MIVPHDGFGTRRRYFLLITDHDDPSWARIDNRADPTENTEGDLGGRLG
jgi:hypothetical protein